MKKQVLTFGLIAGAILGGMTAVMVPLCMNDTLDFDHAEVFGYTIQVLAFLLVFFAVRSYRENVGGGVLTFGKGLQVGILVTLVAATVYVASWEIVYYGFLPDFGDKYAAHLVEGMRAKGASVDAIEKTTREMARFKEMYRNPFFNTGMTYLEVLPVGLLVTIVSAGILRRKAAKAPPAVPSASPAA